VRCFFAPAQIDTCTPALLKEAKRFADEERVPYQVHTSQSVVEFNEMVARHGKTPIAWMRDLGVLGPNTILGHAIIIGGSSWTNYPAGDVAIMAEAGCSVAHAVWVFARRGVAMESFASTARPRQLRRSARTPIRRRDRGHALGSRRLEDDGANTESTTAAHAFDATRRRPGAGPRRPVASAKADLVPGRPFRAEPRFATRSRTSSTTPPTRTWIASMSTGGWWSMAGVLAVDDGAILNALQAAGDHVAAHEQAGLGRTERRPAPQTYPEWDA
jgi:hypothetical protein